MILDAVSQVKPCYTRVFPPHQDQTSMHIAMGRVEGGPTE